MSIKHDNVAAFYDAIKEFKWAEMYEVAMEISAYLEPGIMSVHDVAQALGAAACGEPTNKVVTRG